MGEGSPLGVSWTSLVGISVLSLVLPFAIFIGRNNIRYVRQQILNDLEKVFRFRDEDGDKLIPSFEFAAYKYRALPSKENAAKDYSIGAYVLPTGIFVVITILGFILVSGSTTQFAMSQHESHAISYFLVGTLDPIDERTASYMRQTAAVASIAFLGGYIWSIQYLLRRIANFDLSPMSFLRASARIVLGSFVAVVLRHVYHDLSSARLITEASPVGLNWLLGPAFLIGLFPTMGLDLLLDKFPRLQMKRIDDDARRNCQEQPLDIIDGIDSFIKFRLGEFEIEDVQNLATINPIQLFVETPYGIYEIINWISQAQLVVAVTPQQLSKLRRICVRNVFDLRNYVANPSTCAMLAEAFSIEEGPRFEASIMPVVVRSILADLHVQRLYQIWVAIEHKLKVPTRREHSDPSICYALTASIITRETVPDQMPT